MQRAPLLVAGCGLALAVLAVVRFHCEIAHPAFFGAASRQPNMAPPRIEESGDGKTSAHLMAVDDLPGVNEEGSALGSSVEPRDRNLSCGNPVDIQTCIQDVTWGDPVRQVAALEKLDVYMLGRLDDIVMQVVRGLLWSSRNTRVILLCLSILAYSPESAGFSDLLLFSRRNQDPEVAHHIDQHLANTLKSDFWLFLHREGPKGVDEERAQEIWLVRRKDAALELLSRGVHGDASSVEIPVETLRRIAMEIAPGLERPTWVEADR